MSNPLPAPPNNQLILDQRITKNGCSLSIHNPVIYCWKAHEKEFSKNQRTFFLTASSTSSLQKMQKRALFSLQKGTPNLTSPYDDSLFTIFLTKHIFEKNNSSRATSGSQTQF